SNAGKENAGQDGEQNSQSGARPSKMGHAGTLDPMATGLLMVLVGRATKQQEQFMGLEKTYQAEVTLGATSSTDDAEGTIYPAGDQPAGGEPSSNPQPEEKQVQKLLEQFRGTTQQVPPQYSAIKVEGQRAYALARNGAEVELEPRSVVVYEISAVVYQYPALRFMARVSSGTYLRSLARDIGQSLGTGGYLSSLRRVAIGDYSVEAAVSPESDKAHISAAIRPTD
ncbi:tRNA pseudouridine(55) synthase TruB, partial [Candidatus Saccharibacteria bacterium SW_7_54_9]